MFTNKAKNEVIIKSLDLVTRRLEKEEENHQKIYESLKTK
jgi:hypothetical protein